MAERLRLPAADDTLVIELDSVHTVTGARREEQVVEFGRDEPVRTFLAWEYVCSCGELGLGRYAEQATQHIAEVRRRAPSPSAAGS